LGVQASGKEVALALCVTDAKDVDSMAVAFGEDATKSVGSTTVAFGEDVVNELGVAMVLVIVRAM